MHFPQWFPKQQHVAFGAPSDTMAEPGRLNHNGPPLTIGSWLQKAAITSLWKRCNACPICNACPRSGWRSSSTRVLELRPIQRLNVDGYDRKLIFAELPNMQNWLLPTTCVRDG